MASLVGRTPRSARDAHVPLLSPSTKADRLGSRIEHMVHKVEPSYSEEARKCRLEGTVVLYVVIRADGRPHDFKVLQSIGLDLDEKAIEAVSAWEFAPGMKSGEPVNVAATIQVNFRLTNSNSHLATWHLAKVQFESPGGVTRPAIETASDGGWAKDVIAALAKWKFTPARRDGVAVLSSCTIEFVRGH